MAVPQLKFRRVCKSKEIQRLEWIVIELFRFILEAKLGKRIYFSQTDIHMFAAVDGYNEWLQVEMRTIFTGIDDPFRCGREGLPPSTRRPFCESIS